MLDFHVCLHVLKENEDHELHAVQTSTELVAHLVSSEDRGCVLFGLLTASLTACCHTPRQALLCGESCTYDQSHPAE